MTALHFSPSILFPISAFLFELTPTRRQILWLLFHFNIIFVAFAATKEALHLNYNARNAAKQRRRLMGYASPNPQPCVLIHNAQTFYCLYLSAPQR